MTTPSLQIVFFGSSDFSLSCLEFLIRSPHRLAAVVTVPDQPKGRGLKQGPNPVKARAGEEKIEVLAPARLRDPKAEERVRDFKPDLFVVIAYGKLIPDSWLTIPSKAALNIHPSLLPKYRGAAPLPWQIIEGEKESGITILEVTKELDAGDIFHQIHIPLQGEETTASLTQKLSQTAVHALEEVLEKIAKGNLTKTSQNGALATYARKLKKADGRLDLNEPAEILERKIRAFHPWPGGFIDYHQKPLRLVEARADPKVPNDARAGTLLEVNPSGFLRIQAGRGVLCLLKVQLSGRKVISGQDFANGERLKPGFCF